ncbi:MAG: glutamine--tRNA ligase/YqeY domain fusion protein, partial [Sediminibacterium sp.]|nr:glutamine--tRNA ligase/YqeY domain fusion protein [Sediminibacterium sp.]
MIEEKKNNFIEEIIEADIRAENNLKITTRFPPEPNGYLHIGHAKSICLNFGLSKKYGGTTNLRFDDTNPTTEEENYVDSIKKDIEWLGFNWDKVCYASDYFEQLYQFAVALIKKGLAYIDDSTAEEIANQKGTPTIAGIESKYRNRSVEENVALFEKMRAGEFLDSTKVLRAKIDMAHPNMHFRDPIMYRIKHSYHHKTKNDWCIYPMYDFAHGQSDAIEKITHSICTLEFIPHRPLYDWYIEKLSLFPSKQYEFARLNLTYTVMSKRKLLELVNSKIVEGWDDPRMPTISGLRRRGYTPESINNFCDKIGVAKRENLIELSLLEFCIREHLNKIAQRIMVVKDPIKIIITNFHDNIEWVESENNPEDENATKRTIPFSKEIFIERADFEENPPKKYFRLAPNTMVRLKSAYIITCNEVIKNEAGKVICLHCTYNPQSKSGEDKTGLIVKGTIHWVSVNHAQKIQLNIYQNLFTVEDTSSIEGDFKEYINPQSLQVIEDAVAESYILGNKSNHYQFIRNGYFVKDINSTENKLIFNQTVTL